MFHSASRDSGTCRDTMLLWRNRTWHHSGSDYLISSHHVYKSLVCLGVWVSLRRTYVYLHQCRLTYAHFTYIRCLSDINLFAVFYILLLLCFTYTFIFTWSVLALLTLMSKMHNFIVWLSHLKQMQRSHWTILQTSVFSSKHLKQFHRIIYSYKTCSV